MVRCVLKPNGKSGFAQPEVQSCFAVHILAPARWRSVHCKSAPWRRRRMAGLLRLDRRASHRTRVGVHHLAALKSLNGEDAQQVMRTVSQFAGGPSEADRQAFLDHVRGQGKDTA